MLECKECKRETVRQFVFHGEEKKYTEGVCPKCKRWLFKVESVTKK